MLWDYFSCFIFICYKWALGDLVRVMWPCAHKFVLVGWRNSRVKKGVGAHKSNEESVNYSDSSKTSTKDRLIRPFHSYSPHPCLSCSWNTGGGGHTTKSNIFLNFYLVLKLSNLRIRKKKRGGGGSNYSEWKGIMLILEPFTWLIVSWDSIMYDTHRTTYMVEIIQISLQMSHRKYNLWISYNRTSDIQNNFNLCKKISGDTNTQLQKCCAKKIFIMCT